MTEAQIIIALAGVITGLASTVSVVAGFAWKARGETIVDLKDAFAKVATALNDCRNAQLAELRTNLDVSNRNLNAATQAIQASVQALESRSEVEDRILSTTQAVAQTVSQNAVTIDRIERQTEACMRGAGRST